MARRTFSPRSLHLFVLVIVNVMSDSESCKCSEAFVDCSSIITTLTSQNNEELFPCGELPSTHTNLTELCVVMYSRTNFSTKTTTKTIVTHPRIHVLNVESNYLFGIHFSGDSNLLEYVLASHNSLGSSPENFLQGDCKIRKLMVRDNNLSALDLVVDTCENLEYLDASHNNLTTVPENIVNLTKLEYLLLSNNYLSESGMAVTLPASLKVIDLSFNNFMTCPALEDTINLQTLILSHNKIVTLDMSVTLLSIERLDLSHNLLTNLNMTRTSGNTTNLRELDVSHNHLTEIPFVDCDSFNALRLLNVTNNEISDLTVSLSLMNNAMCRFHFINQEIDLRGNAFVERDDMLESRITQWSLVKTCLDSGCECKKISRPLFFTTLYLCVGDATERANNTFGCDDPNTMSILLLTVVALLLAVLTLWCLILMVISERNTPEVQDIEVKLIPSKPKHDREKALPQGFRCISASRSLDWT